jgi:hypothetical protein
LSCFLHPDNPVHLSLKIFSVLLATLMKFSIRALGLVLFSLCLGLLSVDMAVAQRRAAVKYVCPMHPLVTSSQPGNCPRCEMALVATSPVKIARKRRKPAKRNLQARSASGKHRAATATSTAAAAPAAEPRSLAALSTAERVRAMERLAPTYDYTCPMHPDVHQAQEGLCPKCGMPLLSVKPSVLGQYQLTVTSLPRAPQVGEKVQLRFVISEPQTGARVKRFVINHEKLFHLFIVSEDLAEYQHIHPQLEPDGSFFVETVLPQRGLYKLHADFFPIGGTSQVIQRELVTAGYGRLGQAKAAPPFLTPDATLTKTVDGMTVNLEMGVGDSSSSLPVAGAFIPLKYRLTDAQTGAPVQDLEPYLGAWGHTLILNADQSAYLHSHPTQMLPGGVEQAKMRGGPAVEFGVMFPEAGDYRIWTQFKRAGKILTVAFTVRVNPAL